MQRLRYAKRYEKYSARAPDAKSLRLRACRRVRACEGGSRIHYGRWFEFQ